MNTCMCPLTFSQSQTHMHTHTQPGSVSEEKSSSTFPLHQSQLYATSVSPGLSGLAAARDFLTCPFVAEPCVCVCERECVCLHVCVYLWSQVKPFPPIDVILSAWHAQTNSFIVWIQKWSLNSPHSSIKWMRVFIHMWIHEDFFYDHKPEQQVFVIIYKLNMYRLDFTRVSFISSTTQVGNAVACWSLLVTFYATADVCVLVRFGCESLSVNMCALDHNSYFLTIVPL